QYLVPLQSWKTRYCLKLPVSKKLYEHRKLKEVERTPCFGYHFLLASQKGLVYLKTSYGLLTHTTNDLNLDIITCNMQESNERETT
ncbi:hypothetical protein L9F63_023249, partial [Diploptera punctata]